MKEHPLTAPAFFLIPFSRLASAYPKMPSDSSQTNLSSTAASIHSWLEGLPQFYTGFIRPTSERSSNKRKTKGSYNNFTGTEKSKRVFLGSISTNRMPPIDPTIDEDENPGRSPRKPATSKTQHPQTPLRTKKTKGRSFTALKPSLQQSYPLDLEDEETPRALSTHLSTSNPSIPPSPARSQKFSDRLSDRSGDSQGIDHGSSAASTASSINKPTDTFLLDVRIEIRTLGTKKHPVPKSFSALYDDLRRIGRGRDVIPPEFKTLAEKELELNEGIDEPSYFIARERASFMQATKPNKERSTKEIWRRIQLIQKAALECSDESLPECAWNEEVHSKILRLTLEGHWETQNIWYRNITQARITDKRLLPKKVAAAIRSKMVDYSVVIRPPQSPDIDLIRQHLRMRDLEYLNQADAPYLKDTLLAVNIETKPASIDQDKGHAQLGVWTSAQYTKFQQLNPELKVEDLPVLPLIMIQGHRWELMIAYKSADDELILLGHETLGSTNTVRGVFQIVAAVERLAVWCREDYWSWYRKAILELEKQELIR